MSYYDIVQKDLLDFTQARNRERPRYWDRFFAAFPMTLLEGVDEASLCSNSHAVLTSAETQAA